MLFRYPVHDFCHLKLIVSYYEELGYIHTCLNTYPPGRRFNRIYNYGGKDEDTSFSTVRAPGAIDSIRAQD